VSRTNSAPAVVGLSAWCAPAEVEAYMAAELTEFFATKIDPFGLERDEACEPIPREVFGRAAELGLLNYLIPREAGGWGGSRRVFGLLLEYMGYFCEDAAFPSMLSMFADIPNVIYRSGRSELIEDYVRPMAQGEKFGTFAFTDYGDAFTFQTRAVRTGNGYVVKGVKCLQTGGLLADAFVTYARDENEGLCVLLIDRSDPGVSLVGVPTMGLRSAGLSQLTLRDVEVPAERRLGGPDGLADAQVFLNSRRLYTVCPFVGAMRRMIEICIRHLDSTIREARPLTQAQTVQARLGEMYATRLTSEAILHNALDTIERGEANDVFDATVSAAKYVLAENVVEVGERALRLTGWRGYAKQYPLERMYRAAVAALTAQTAQDILQINLGVLAMSHLTLQDQAERSRQ
jgi:butyryl-CoA dehydrogenase